MKRLKVGCLVVLVAAAALVVLPQVFNSRRASVPPSPSVITSPTAPVVPTAPIAERAEQPVSTAAPPNAVAPAPVRLTSMGDVQALNAALSRVSDLVDQLEKISAGEFDDAVRATFEKNAARVVDQVRGEIVSLPAVESRDRLAAAIDELSTAVAAMALKPDRAASLRGELRAIRGVVSADESRIRAAIAEAEAERRRRDERARELRRPITDLQLGAVGTIGPFRVEQVLGDREMLVELIDHADASVLIRGVSTDSVADGQAYRPDRPFEVVGTHRFETVIGGSRQVFVLEPVAE